MNPGWKVLEQKRDGARLEAEVTDEPQLAAALRKMIVDGVPVVEFRREERRLEDAFVEMIKVKKAPAAP
jgi:ABC-2 type transport system ATP-binding protein